MCARAGNSRSRGDVLRFRRVMTRGHYPTEKPVGLLKTLIGQSTHPGELVCDPFCGSGSLGVAARLRKSGVFLCDVDASVASARFRLAVVGSTGTPARRKGSGAGQGFRHAQGAAEGATA